MTKHSVPRLATFAGLLFSAASLVSCSKEDLVANGRKPKTTVSAPTTTDGGTTGTTDPILTPTTNALYNLSVNWTGRPDGAYGYTQSVTDFKSVSYWDGNRTNIAGGTMRTTLLKNMIGPSGGTVSKVDAPDGSEYSLQFDMMFASDFDFSAGGKVGYGFLIGEGNTGGDAAWDGNGGSARIMWSKKSDGSVALIPYLYYKDQPGTYGNDFGKRYPATGSITKGVWHTVKMYVKSNTGSNTDGHVTMTINGVTLLDQDIRWTTNDLQRLVKHVCFETFRGGAESYWQSATDGNIYFNNVSYSVLKN